MTIRNKTRAGYESQTPEARARRNDKSTYEFATCEVCGGTIVIWNGKRGQCAMCELKNDEEAAELAREQTQALRIVLDVANTPKRTDPRIARRESILASFQDEPLSKVEASELYGELAEIDQALQFHPSNTCQDYIGAAWEHIEEAKF